MAYPPYTALGSVPSAVARALPVPVMVSTSAKRKFWLVLLAPMLVGMKTQVTRSLSPLLARFTSLPSPVKYVVHDAEDVPPVVMLPRSGPPAATGFSDPAPAWNHADSRFRSVSLSTPFSEYV